MPLTLEQKIGQMMMVGFHGLEPPDYILEWLTTGRIGGVYLFARNVAHPEQVASLAQACHEAASTPILIGIDQEGGIVARLRQGFTESPGAMALGTAGSADLADRVSHMLATEMIALGINWNFAPVVDVTHDINNPSVGTRSPGSDKTLVAKIAQAQVAGFQRGGVAASAKHFPGLGNTPIDTHLALAEIDGPVDYLYENDLVPFRAVVNAGVATVMVSHVKFNALDANHPATLSPVIIRRLLREEIGFNRVACTDCMEMRAITDHYGSGEAAVLAVLADIDLIMFSHTPEYQAMAYDSVLQAVRTGRLAEDRIDTSVERIQRLKQQFLWNGPPALDRIRHPEHVRLANEAARAGVALLQADDSVFPLGATSDKRVVVVEFASHLDSGVMDEGGQTGFVTLLKERAPHLLWCVSLRATDIHEKALSAARRLVNEAEVLVLATRNAHLIPEQQVCARELMAGASPVILLCLRNPYDVNVLPGAGTIICTCGDSTPSLQAAVDALLGEFTPSGTLPVPTQAGAS